MAALISKHIGKGLVRRCDGACHFATQSVCNCVCGGRYHGLGSTAKAAAAIAADYGHSHGSLADPELRAIFEGARVTAEIRLEAKRLAATV
jgi:hypothetical protein